MFVEELRKAVLACERRRLPELAGAVWKGHGAGALDDDQAQHLAELIEARKVVSAQVGLKLRKRGSKPRSAASLERRRRWVASGWLPPQLTAQFTQGELAVLSVVAAEATKRGGECRLFIDAIGALAGVCRSLVQKALRLARDLGLVTVDEWRITAWRNGPNTVRVVSPEWKLWLRMAARRDRGRIRTVCGPSERPAAGQGGGCRTVSTTNTDSDRLATTRAERGLARGGTARFRPSENRYAT